MYSLSRSLGRSPWRLESLRRIVIDSEESARSAAVERRTSDPTPRLLEPMAGSSNGLPPGRPSRCATAAHEVSVPTKTRSARLLSPRVLAGLASSVSSTGRRGVVELRASRDHLVTRPKPKRVLVADVVPFSQSISINCRVLARGARCPTNVLVLVLMMSPLSPTYK